MNGLDTLKGVAGNPAFAFVGGAIAGGSIIGATAYAINRRKKKNRKSAPKKRAKARKGRKRQYKYARTAGKAKDRSTKRIRMTKNGQPYIILKSGKARFIKKSSARSSRKRKGGRY